MTYITNSITSDKKTQDVQGFLKAYDELTEKYNTKIEDMITEKNTNKYQETILNIFKILDKYCNHITVIPQHNLTRIGLPCFIQLYEEYEDKIEETITQINKELTPLLNENFYIELDIIYKKDNSFPDELIRPVDKNYLFNEINKHYKQEIYKIKNTNQ